MLMNRSAYQQLIDEDLRWLLTHERSLERDHIELILRWSIGVLYDGVPVEAFVDQKPQGVPPLPAGE